MLGVSTSRGVSEVWQMLDLERCVLGSVAIVGLTGEFSDLWQLKDLGENGPKREQLLA